MYAQCGAAEHRSAHVCPQPRLCRKKAAARALTGAQQCTIRSICSRASTREYSTPEYLLCLRQYYDAAYVCAAASLKLVTSRKLRVPPQWPSGLRTVGALAAVLAVPSQWPHSQHSNASTDGVVGRLYSVDFFDNVFVPPAHLRPYWQSAAANAAEQACRAGLSTRRYCCGS